MFYFISESEVIISQDSTNNVEEEIVLEICGKRISIPRIYVDYVNTEVNSHHYCHGTLIMIKMKKKR